MSDSLLLFELEKIAQKIADKEGCELYDLEFVGAGRGRTLRVFIDREAGIGIDECTKVAREMNTTLDELDLIPGGAYNLEVSSPGLERTLRQFKHFERAKGEKIDFRLSQSLGTLGVEEKRWENCKHTEGQILETHEGVVALELSGGAKVNIPFELFEKAKVVFDFSKPRNKR